MRKLAKESGRDPASIKAFIGIIPVLGRIMEEAQAKFKVA